MGGTTKKPADAGTDDGGVAALTAERDQAVADLAAARAEGEQRGAALQAIGEAIIAAELAPEGVWSAGDRAVELIGALAGYHGKVRDFGQKMIDMGIPIEEGQDAADLALERIAALTAERDQAVADLAKATVAHDRTKADLKTARAKAGPKAAKPRAIGPVPAPKGHDGPWSQPSGEDLLTLIGAADLVEIGFSDGTRELATLAPRIVEGDAWYLAANGVRLRVPELRVNGPGRDDQPLTLAGYGLFLNGELTAWSPRIDILQLAPGGQYDLKDDVIFQ